jgi:hypothetical protein
MVESVSCSINFSFMQTDFHQSIIWPQPLLRLLQWLRGSHVNYGVLVGGVHLYLQRRLD